MGLSENTTNLSHFLASIHVFKAINKLFIDFLLVVKTRVYFKTKVLQKIIEIT
jgi:hypothetical protein